MESLPSQGRRRTRVVVLGMGFAGLEAVRELTLQTEQPMDITIIAPNTHFIVGLSQAFLMLGALEKMDIALPALSARCLLPHDEGGPSPCHSVQRVRDYATFIDWKQQKVLLRSGARAIPYDYLVVATGAKCVRSNIPGLLGNAFDICNPDDNEMLSAALEALAATAGPHCRKRVLVTVTSLPYRCPMAPMEWAMLIDARLRAYGVREYVDLVYAGPEPQLLPLAGAVGNLFLSEVLRRRSIQVQCGATVTAVTDACAFAADHPETAERPLPSGSKIVELELTPTPAFVKPGALETRIWPNIPSAPTMINASQQARETLPAATVSASAAASASSSSSSSRSSVSSHSVGGGRSKRSSRQQAPRQSQSRPGTTTMHGPSADSDPSLRANAKTRVLAGADIIVASSLLVAPECVTRSFPTSPEHGNARFLPTCRVSQATQYPRVFAAGDVTDIRLRCQGLSDYAPSHPKTGHFAKQMAQLAAINILADVKSGGALSAGSGPVAPRHSMRLPVRTGPSLSASTITAPKIVPHVAAGGLENLAAAAAAFAAAGAGDGDVSGHITGATHARNPSSASASALLSGIVPPVPRAAMTIAVPTTALIQTPSEAAAGAAIANGIAMKNMAPGWWWSGDRSPIVRWGVCAFQTDGVRAVAVRVDIPLSDGPAVQVPSRPASPSSAIVTVDGGGGDSDGEPSRALALAVASTRSRHRRAASIASSSASGIAAASSSSTSKPRRDLDSRSAAAKPSGRAGPASNASVLSASLPTPVSASSLVSDTSLLSAGEAHELTFSFNMPSEAAMEYLLLFWRSHLHRWFHIPADICPPHLTITIPSFLTHRLSEVASTTSPTSAQLTTPTEPGAETSSGHVRGILGEPSHHSRMAGYMFSDLADSAADEQTWAALKDEIDLEHKQGRAGDPTAVLVGPLLQAVARKSRVSETARNQLLSAVASGFDLSQRGGLTTAQAIAHGVPLAAVGHHPPSVRATSGGPAGYQQPHAQALLLQRAGYAPPSMQAAAAAPQTHSVGKRIREVGHTAPAAASKRGPPPRA